MNVNFPKWSMLAALLAFAPWTFACGGNDGGSNENEHELIEIPQTQDAGEGDPAPVPDAGQGVEGEDAAIAPDPALEENAGHETVRSNRARAAADAVSGDEVAAFTRSQREFNADLFHRMAGEFSGKNAMISALSIHQALGMTYAGAMGETASQMAGALRLGGNSHAAQNALSLLLASRNQEAVHNDYISYDAVELSIANALWAQSGMNWKSDFLDTLAEYYGAGVETLDFKHAFEPARQYINAWVADQTKDRIQNLLPPGSLTEDTVSVLTNAVYFKAPWKEEFNPSRNDTFNTLDGTEVKVPFVQLTERLPYAAGEGWAAAQKPFLGGKLAMLFILPEAGTFESFVETLDAEKFDGVVSALSSDRIVFSVPKFEFTTSMALKEPLTEMGMSDAFDRRNADFSGMTDDAQLWIDAVIHKTFIALDERGVEAAAATAVGMSGTTSVEDPPKPLVLDRPFVFAIRDIESGAVLFYGQVLNPADKSE